MAIVGAGASGTLVAAHLLAHAGADGQELRVVLIDQRERGGGVAYGTAHPAHRLNVPAALMSAFADDPDHFVRWHSRRSGVDDPAAYAARGDYGYYLADVLAQAERHTPAGVSLIRLAGEVHATRPLRELMRVELAGGGVLDADAVVLALGNLAPVAPPGSGPVLHDPHFIADPWAHGALDRLEDRQDEVGLLIGTGLTMIDVALTLAARHPGMRLRAVSRSGLLPRAHLESRPPSRPTAVSAGDDASLVRAVDEVLADSYSGGTRWYGLVDALRPMTQELWQRLSLAQRGEFIISRHRPWSAHRHRMAPEVARMTEALIAAGQLGVGRGSVELTPGPRGRIEAELSDGGSLSAGFVVNCTGPGLDPLSSRLPLVRQLLESGQVRAHPLGLGFDTAAGGVLRTREGAVHPRLFTLGPPRFGELYETTAVPEIRAQASALAASLAGMALADSDTDRLSA